MPRLVPPHASPSLKPRMPQGELLAAERARAKALRRVRVSSREKGDLVILGIGGVTPLVGFMSRAVWVGEQADAAAVEPGISRHDGPALLVRAVVHDQQLPVPELLRPHALDGLLQPGGPSADRHHHRDGRDHGR